MIDASGGWWDAGDYLKFVETHSYTVALMLQGVRDFPNQMGAGSSTLEFHGRSQIRPGLAAENVGRQFQDALLPGVASLPAAMTL